MKSYAYRWKDTPIHRLHPLVITVWALACMVLVFSIQDPILLIILFLAMLVYVFTAGIFDRWWNFFKLALVFSALIIVLNVLFMHQGTTILYSFPYEVPTMGHFDITLEAFFYAVGMSISLTVVITLFAILTYTVNPDDIFELLMKARVFQRTAFVSSLAVTYVPTILSDMGDIKISLQTRGYEMDGGKLIEKIKRKSAILIPLLTNSLDRALQKAESMEARAYGTGKGRTYLFYRKMTGFDIFLLVMSVLPLVAAILCVLIPVGKYQFYPQLQPVVITGGYVAAALLLFMVVSSVDFLSLLKRRVDID